MLTVHPKANKAVFCLSSCLLPWLVMVNDVPIAKLGVVFCAFMPSEYPYCAFRI